MGKSLGATNKMGDSASILSTMGKMKGVFMKMKGVFKGIKVFLQIVRKRWLGKDTTASGDNAKFIYQALETMSNPSFGSPIVVPPQFQIYECVSPVRRELRK
jgi:hypothetical protein